MAERLETRPIEQSIKVFYCDRCTAEIPSERGSYGKPSAPIEGASVTARGQDEWVPLIDPASVERITHSAEFHAANVLLCGSCTEQLQMWFRRT